MVDNLSIIALIAYDFQSIVLRNIPALTIGLAIVTVRLIFGLSRRAS